MTDAYSLWQPHTRRWARHTDVAGSSDARPGLRIEVTRQSDNRNHLVQLGNRCVPRTTHECSA
jgi:hypothetical protein